MHLNMSKKAQYGIIGGAVAFFAVFGIIGSVRGGKDKSTSSVPNAETNIVNTVESVPAVEAFNSLATSESSTPQINEENVNAFFNVIKVTLPPTVGEGEAVTNLNYLNGKVTISVDISKSAALEKGFSPRDIAEARNSSITDELLKADEYDYLWNDIVVDFGATGQIINHKNDITDDGSGRYFKSPELKLSEIAVSTPATETPAAPVSEPELTPAPVVSSKPQTPAADFPEATNPVSSIPSSVKYVLNTSTHKVHKPSCYTLSDMDEENLDTTDDLQWALANGYEACKKCHPH